MIILYFYIIIFFFIILYFIIIISLFIIAETFGKVFDEVFKSRKEEMDQYYDTIIPSALLPEERNVVLQGFAG